MTNLQKNHGKLYYEFLSTNSCKEVPKEIKKYSKDISESSQSVHSLISSSFEYENTHKICKQLGIVSTRLFLESNSLLEYAETFSNVLKRLMSNDFSAVASVQAQNLKTIKNYWPSSKFIRGTDISKELMKHGISLENGQKSSMLLVVGGHTVSIAMLNYENDIIFCYHDPHYGQLYKQSVTKSELNHALEGNNKFAHLRSILNENNILLGQLSLKDDSSFSDVISFALMTVFTRTQTIDSEQKVAFSEDIKPDDVISYLAQMPKTLDNMSGALKPKVFSLFLKQYGKKLISEMSRAKDCADKISGCNDYLREILYAVYRNTREIQHDIKKLFRDSGEANEPSALFKGKEKICVKEIKPCDGRSRAEKEFFRILIDDNAKLYEAMLQCLTQKEDRYEAAVAKKVCEDFSNVDPVAFTKAHKAYYDYIDSRYGYGYQEKCYDLANLDENLAIGNVVEEFTEDL